MQNAGWLPKIQLEKSKEEGNTWSPRVELNSSMSSLKSTFFLALPARCGSYRVLLGDCAAQYLKQVSKNRADI